MIKQVVVHPYHGILFNKKKGTINTLNKLYERPENYAEWTKKANFKRLNTITLEQAIPFI